MYDYNYNCTNILSDRIAAVKELIDSMIQLCKF